MLEGVLARFLASRLGRFLEGVDEENLKVAIWRGDILLDNLALKPEAFESLGLPPGIRLKWGRVGSFHLSIPWNALGTAPLAVTLKEVRLVFGTVHGEGWDEEEARRRQRAAKERVVGDRLKFLKANRAVEVQRTTHEQQQPLSSRLLSSLFNNIQFHLSKVHVRFEYQDGSGGDGGLCLGLRLNNFKVENESREGDCICKKAAATAVAVYCDPHSTPLDPTAPTTSSSPPHQYLLHPASATFSIELRPLPTAQHPKYKVTGHVGRINVALTREQICRFVALYASLKALRLIEQYSRWRPQRRPSEDPRGWWRYAYQCVRMRPKRGRLRWPHLVYVVRHRKRYINLYKRKLAGGELYPILTSEEAEEMAGLEDGLEVEDLVYFRTLAEAEVEKEQAMNLEAMKEQQKNESTVLWLVKGAVRSVMGAGPRGLAGDTGEISLTEEERQALYDAIAYSETIAHATIPADYRIWHVDLSLNEGSVSYLESQERPSWRVIVDTSLIADLRPHSWTADLVVGAVEVFDLDPATEYRTVVTRKSTAGDGSEGGGGEMIKIGDFLVAKNAEMRIDFNISRVQGGRDVAFKSRILPFEIFYSRPMIEGVLMLLNDPRVEVVRAAAVEGLGRWQAQQQEKLLQSILQRQRLFIDVQIDAPVVLVPEDRRGERKRLLVVDLGQFIFRNDSGGGSTDLASSSTASSAPLTPEEDLWVLRVANMNLGMCSDAAAYVHQTQAKEDIYSIVETFDLNFAVKTAVHAETHSLHRIHLDVSLPRLAVNLTSSILRFLYIIDEILLPSIELSSSISTSTTLQPPTIIQAPLLLDNRPGSRPGSGRLIGLRLDTFPPPLSRGTSTNSGMNSPVHFGATEHDPVEESRTIGLRFSAALISFHLEDDMGGLPLVDAAIEGVLGDYVNVSAKKTHELVIEVRSVEVIDQHPFSDPSFAPIVSTKSGEVSTFRLIQSEEMGSQMTLNMDALELQWNPDTISAIQDFFKAPSSSLDMSLWRSSLLDRSQTSAAPAPPPKRGKKRGTPPVYLIATLGNLKVSLNKEGELRRIVMVTATGSQFIYQCTGKTKELICMLDDFRATEHCNLSTKYPTVIEAPRGKAECPVTVRYYSKGIPTERLEADNILEVEVESLRLVYFQQYWLEFVDYLCEGVLGDAIWGTLRKADALVRQQLRSKTAFAVTIASAEVILPRHLTSNEYASFDFGTAGLQLTTTLSARPVTLGGSTPAVEEVVMRILEIRGDQLNLTLHSDYVDGLPAFREPVACEVDFVRALDSDYAALLIREHDADLHMSLNFHLSSWVLWATPANYAFVRRVLNDNIFSSRHHAEDSFRSLRMMPITMRPLPISSPARSPLDGGMEGKLEQQQQQESPMAACSKCHVRYKDLKDTPHHCPQCGAIVCRRCLSVSVFDKDLEAVRRICHNCAVNHFPLLFRPTSFGGRSTQRVAYGYGLEEGPLSEFKINLTIKGFELCTHDLNTDGSHHTTTTTSHDGEDQDPPWVKTASFNMGKLHLHFHRFSDGRKLLDVSLYELTVRDLRPSALPLPDILSPYHRELRSISSSSSIFDDELLGRRGGDNEQESPLFVFRYTSGPSDPSSMHYVLNDVCIFMLFDPILYLMNFFGKLLPDRAPPHVQPPQQQEPLPKEPSVENGDNASPCRSTFEEDESASWSQYLERGDSQVEADNEEEEKGPSTEKQQLPQEPAPMLHSYSKDLAADEEVTQVISRIKIMIHNPMIIFLEGGEMPDDDDDTADGRRALVIRGRSVANYVSEVERRAEGVLPKACWSGQVDKLECYICPDALKTRLYTGVSLLNPVTVAFTYDRSYSLLRCPVRRVNLDLDSMTVYFSYRDLEVVRHITEGWYRANVESRRNRRWSSQQPELPVEMSNTLEESTVPAMEDLGYGSDESEGEEEEIPYYEISFHDIRLGMTLQRLDNDATRVERVETRDGYVEGRHPRPGDHVVTVNGNLGSHADIIKWIKVARRPIKIGFHRAKWADLDQIRQRSDSTICSVHVNLDDIMLHHSKVPDSLLISDKTARGGTPHAQVVGINGRSVEGLGYRLAIDSLKAASPPLILQLREVCPPSRVNDVEATLSSISILFIDDYDGRDMPLLKANAFNCAGRTRQVLSPSAQPGLASSSLIDAASKVEVMLEYYNGRIGCWEPCLEHVALKCRAVKQSEQEHLTLPPTSFLSVELVATNDLNINVTDACLELVLRTVEEWKTTAATSDVPPSPSLTHSSSSGHLPLPLVGAERNRGCPYVFRNETGCPCRFWVVQQESASSMLDLDMAPKPPIRRPSESREEITIWEAPPDIDVPFSVCLETSSSSKRSLASGSTVRREYDTIQTIFLRLQGPPPLDAELYSLPMNKIGSYLFSVYNTARRSDEDSDRVAVLWEVSEENGRRILTLRSTIEVENTSGYPLEIRHSGEAVERAQDLLTVGVWGKVRLPLGWTAGPDIRLQIRPYGYNQYGWSGTLCRCLSEVKDFVLCPSNRLEGEESVVISDAPPSPSKRGGNLPPDQPLVFQLEAVRSEGKEDATAQDALRGRGETWCIRVYASVTLVNLLPVPVRYAWREVDRPKSSDTPAEVGQLLSGEEKALHYIHLLKGDMEVCVKLDGLHRSEWVTFRSQEEASVIPVKLRDDLNNSFVINLEIKPNGPHGLTVTVFVDYWVQNLTNLPIVLGEPLPTLEDLEGVYEIRASAIQGSPVVEEVFEYQTNRSRGAEIMWCNEFGRHLPSKDNWPLPSQDFWEWEDPEWRVDLSGAVDRETGWESSRVNYRDSFRPARNFRSGDRFYRRRWIRRRVPVPPSEETKSPQEPSGFTNGDRGKSVIMYQTRFHQSTSTAGAGAGTTPQLSIKIGDSSWATPFDVSLEGAGGAFQLIGNRWPNLEDRSLNRTFYELTYSVSAAPAPWDRTKIITIQNRYMVTNVGPSPLVISQVGADRSAVQYLPPSGCMAFHWPDFQRESTLQISFPSDQGYRWSGGIDISQISELPLVIRPTANAKPRKGEGATAKVGPRVVKVKVELGQVHDIDSSGQAKGSTSTGTMLVSFSEVPQPEYHLSFNSLNTRGFTRLLSNTGEGESPREKGLVEDEDDGLGGALIVLENCSEVNIFVAQMGCPEEDMLLPYTGRCFGWDRTAFPLLELEEGDPFQVRVARYPSSDSRASACSALISPDKVGSTMDLPIDSPLININLLGGMQRCASRQSLMKVRVEVCAEGVGTRVIRFKTVSSDDGHEEPLLTSRRKRMTGTNPWRDTGKTVASSMSSSSVLSKRRRGNRDGIHVRVIVPNMTISVVDETPEELLVLALSDVRATAIMKENSGDELNTFLQGGSKRPYAHLWQGQLSLGSIQVDNHAAAAHFPVVLRPTDGSNEDVTVTGQDGPPRTTRSPCIILSVQIEPRPRITYLKYVGVRTRQLSVNLDQSVIIVFQRLANRIRVFNKWPNDSSGSVVFLHRPRSGSGTNGPISRTHKLPRLSAPITDSKVAEAKRREKASSLYVEALKIDTVSIDLSISRPRQSQPEEVYVGLKFNKMVVDMMYRLDEARLSLHPFTIVHMAASPGQIVSLCHAHYSREVKRHIFQMLGSLRALGKPVALIRGFGKGAQDFISQPLQGLVRSVEEQNPDELFQGVARGADSLLRHTVGGVANSASCITDNISKQISNLAFDKEYKMRRERREARKDKPTDVLEGIGSGGKRLFKGVLEGVTGVVSAPIRGAEKDGLRGLFKGVGKGMIGLVVKPVVGLTDAATEVLQGVQSTTGALTVDQMAQLRRKRALYGADRRLRSYDVTDAQAQFLLARSGFGNDQFEDHVDLGSSVVLISTVRVIFVNEEGTVRQVLQLADVFFVELLDGHGSTGSSGTSTPTAVSGGGAPGTGPTGVVIHYQVKLDVGDIAHRRLLVPCEVPNGRLLKYKIDLAVLSCKSK